MSRLRGGSASRPGGGPPSGPRPGRAGATRSEGKSTGARGKPSGRAQPSSRALTAYTDGAARGNPGPAGAGVWIIDAEGNPVAEETRYLGEATNNVAEYSALIVALERALELGATELEVRSDSELLVRQMTGAYRVKHPGLIPLFERARSLASRIGAVDYVHVRREANREADRLANLAIDQAPSA